MGLAVRARDEVSAARQGDIVKQAKNPDMFLLVSHTLEEASLLWCTRKLRFLRVAHKGTASFLFPCRAIRILTRKKGQDSLQWTFISILVALLFVSFAVSPLQNSVEEAARNTEQIVVQELVSAINLAQASHSTTDYTSFVAVRGKEKCTLEAHDGIVKATFEDNAKKRVVFGHYLVTESVVRVDTPDGQIDCRAGSIAVKKSGQLVTLKGGSS